MSQKEKRKAIYILPASTLGSLISALIVNPFDILKIRQQKASSSLCHTHGSSLMVEVGSSCVCIERQNLIGGIAQIWKREGVKTFLNGLKYSLLASTASTVSYFYMYEMSTSLFKKYITSNSFFLPLIAASFSRIVTTTATFPLEYWRTVQQAHVGFTSNQGAQLGNKIFSAYSVTLQRDVLFSALYWILVENSRASIKNLMGISLNELSGDISKKNTLFVNVLAGSISGGITALATLPLDVVKTRKQLASSSQGGNSSTGNNSSLEIMKQIIHEKGFPGLFAGARPRIAKVVVACGTMLSLYEYFLKIFTSLY